LLTSLIQAGREKKKKKKKKGKRGVEADVSHSRLWGKKERKGGRRVVADILFLSRSIFWGRRKGKKGKGGERPPGLHFACQTGKEEEKKRRRRKERYLSWLQVRHEDDEKRKGRGGKKKGLRPATYVPNHKERGGGGVRSRACSIIKSLSLTVHRLNEIEYGGKEEGGDPRGGEGKRKC